MSYSITASWLHTVTLLLGIYTGSSNLKEEAAFLTERYCLTDLVQGLKTPCPCGRTCNPWAVESIVQVSWVEPDPHSKIYTIPCHAQQKGHVIRLQFSCQRCHREKRTWSSSRVFGARYLLNQK